MVKEFWLDPPGPPQAPPFFCEEGGPPKKMVLEKTKKGLEIA